MTQRRFQDLALLSIEKERTRELYFSDLVEQFVRKNMYKMFCFRLFRLIIESYRMFSITTRV